MLCISGNVISRYNRTNRLEKYEIDWKEQAWQDQLYELIEGIRLGNIKD